MYNLVIKSTIKYSSEIWAMSQTDKKMLATEMDAMRISATTHKVEHKTNE